CERIKAAIVWRRPRKIRLDTNGFTTPLGNARYRMPWLERACRSRGQRSNPGEIVGDARSSAVRHSCTPSLPVLSAWRDVLCDLQAVAGSSHVTHKRVRATPATGV
ncbi:hypothetical protein L2243_20070, partial [Xanthomonas perforans]|nr:hypothetical protein [Xanthomonas perforans]